MSKTAKLALIPAAAGLAAALAGCAGGTGPAAPAIAYFTPQPGQTARVTVSGWPADAALRAWMKEHPVPARPGMTPGVVSFYGTVAGWDQPCPRTGHGSVGDPGVCSAWQVTLVTAGGTLELTCGGPHMPCTSAAYPETATVLDMTRPVSGDYLYAPASGQVSAGHDVEVIRRGAVPLPGGGR